MSAQAAEDSTLLSLLKKPHCWIFIIAFSISFFIFSCLIESSQLLIAYSKIQGNLFTGFLTIGGFILSIKTFVLVRLKSDIYDKEAYEEVLKKLRHTSSGHTRYQSLDNLGSALIFTIFLTLLTSVSHITIGFFWLPYGPIVCSSLTMATLSLVSLCWLLLQSNIRIWFNFIHDEAKIAKQMKQ